MTNPTSPKGFEMVKGTVQCALEDGDEGKAGEVLDSFISKLESLKSQIKGT